MDGNNDWAIRCAERKKLEEAEKLSKGFVWRVVYRISDEFLRTGKIYQIFEGDRFWNKKR